MSKKIYIGDVQVLGADGKSAYQSWLDLGNTGSEADFIAAISGGSTVSWGTESNNTVPLTVDNTSKTMLLSSAKVTSLSSSSTDYQVPSAKCVYDLIGDIETLLAAL